MLVLKQMKASIKLEQLHYTFPRLTEANQQFVLGFAEGLKLAQNAGKKNPAEKTKAISLNKRGRT